MVSQNDPSRQLVHFQHDNLKTGAAGGGENKNNFIVENKDADGNLVEK